MRKDRIKLVWAAWACGLALVSGCTLGGRSYSILDLKTGQTVHVPRESCHREVLLKTDDATRSFHTLYLANNHRDFVLRTVGYDGQVLKKRVFLPFASEYVALYHVHQGYALSPGGSSIAYLDKQTGCLRLFDVEGRTSRPLLLVAATNVVDIQDILWLSDRELLVAVDAEKPYAQILVVDVASGAVRVDLRPAARSLLFGVKTDGTYLVYRDNAWNWHGFRIYDLRKQADVGELVPGTGMSFGFPRLAGNGDPRLFYVEKARETDKHTLIVYDVAAKESKSLKSLHSPGYVRVLRVVRSKLFYETTPIIRHEGTRFVSFDWPRFFVWDIVTQEESEIKGVKTSGVVRVVDDGNRIIYECP